MQPKSHIRSTNGILSLFLACQIKRLLPSCITHNISSTWHPPESWMITDFILVFHNFEIPTVDKIAQ